MNPQFILLNEVELLQAIAQMGRGRGGTATGGRGGGGRGSSSSATSSSSVLGAGNLFRGSMHPQQWIEQEQRRTGAVPGTQSARELGNEAFRAGQLDLALLRYNQSIEEEPDNETGYCNRAAVFIRQGQFEAAVSDARTAIRLKPTWFKGHFRLGTALMSMQQFDEAIDSFKEALKYVPPQDTELTSEINKTIQKCESKRVRVGQAAAPTTGAPAAGAATAAAAGSDTPLRPKLTIATPPQVGSPTATTPLTPFPLSTAGASAPLSATPESLAKELEAAGARRAALRTTMDDAATIRIVKQYDRASREQQMRALMSRCNPETLQKAVEVSQQEQQNLRNAVQSTDRQAFNAALQRRDDALSNLYRVGEECANASQTIQRIVDDETKAAQTIRSQLKNAGLESALTQATDGLTSPLADQPQLEPRELAHRFLEVHARVESLTKSAVSATNAAIVQLAEALRAEAAAFEAAAPLIKEEKALSIQALKAASKIADAPPLLPETQLKEIKEVLSTEASRILMEQQAYEKGAQRGKELLDLESNLEKERLQLEKQRIHLNAELEWTLVKDDDEEYHKLERLRQSVAAVKARLVEIHSRQQAVQQELIELIKGPHPELGWRSSAASGSRVMKWIKGSGLWVNQSFADFEILSTLASTVNSKVYAARNRRGVLVALKEIPMESDKVRRRFQNEVNIINGAAHPNVVPILGVFFDGPFAYIIMPHYSKGSLQKYVQNLHQRRRALTPAGAAGAVVPIAEDASPIAGWKLQEIFRQIVSGISFLHDRGIVHGDIKPSNILLADDLTPIIADFGLARDTGRYGERKDVTWVGSTERSSASFTSLVSGGTEAYMSPELLSGADRAPSVKSDVWSLAVTMHAVAAQNAALTSADLDAPIHDKPLLLPGADRIVVPADVIGGDAKLAELLTASLVVEPAQRPTTHEMLAHPYFSVSLLHDLVVNHQLIESNRKLDALHTYLHAIRSQPRMPALMSVQRAKMVESVTSIFSQLDEPAMLGPLFVVFQGEMGLDDGGLTSEMFTLYFQQAIGKHKLLVTNSANEEGDSDGLSRNVSTLASADPRETTATVRGGSGADGSSAANDPDSGVAGSSGAAAGSSSSSSAAPLLPIHYGSQYLPNPSDTIPTSLFVAFGRVLLKSMIESRPAPFQLNASVVKFLLGIAPTLYDLEEYDKQLVRQLQRMSFMTEEELEISDLDFSEFGKPFLESFFGASFDPETKVTRSRVRDYINAKVQFELVFRRRRALQAIKDGFFMSSTLKPHLELLSPTELQMVLCSQAHIHANDILKSMEFVNFPDSSATPQLFKELVKSLSQHNLRRLLRLCTSAVSVPVGGFSKKIKVVCTADVARLPVGHTCAMQLDLPDYNSAELLASKMAVALAHVNDGFHIA